MNDYYSVNPAKAYLDGMLWAAFGSALYFGKVADWQIEAVKKCASILKEAEIDHSVLSDTDKVELKRQWRQYLDSYTQGLKDELRKEGRMVEAS